MKRIEIFDLNQLEFELVGDFQQTGNLTIVQSKFPFTVPKIIRYLRMFINFTDRQQCFETTTARPLPGYSSYHVGIQNKTPPISERTELRNQLAIY